MLLQLRQKDAGLVLGQSLEAPLEDAAAVRVRREIVDVAVEGRDKRQAFRRHALDQPLHDLRVGCEIREGENRRSPGGN